MQNEPCESELFIFQCVVYGIFDSHLHYTCYMSFLYTDLEASCRRSLAELKHTHHHSPLSAHVGSGTYELAAPMRMTSFLKARVE